MREQESRNRGSARVSTQPSRDNTIRESRASRDRRTSSRVPYSRSTSTTRSDTPSKRPSRQNSQVSFQVIKWIFVILTFLLIGWSVKLLIVDRDEIIAMNNNPVYEVWEEQIVRGKILDHEGNVLAYTEINEDDGSEVRIYPYGASLAHVVGYTGRGDSGLEDVLSSQLLNTTLLRTQVVSWLYEEKSPGDSVRLTLDAPLQSYIYDLMEGYKGAVVITEPGTGAVKVLLSSPSFDPESLVDNWEIVAEREDSPLYNRALQGLYAPGSTFKILTALAMFRSMADLETYSYQCGGYLPVDDQLLYCAGGNVHGDLLIEDAFAYSCNGFFASAGVEMGRDVLVDTADYLGIGEDYGFLLPQSVSGIGLEEYESDGMIAQTSIGQGKVLLTPFALNMLTCAVANGGALYAPCLLEETIDANGGVISAAAPQLLKTVMRPEEADFLKDLMAGVVAYGTGSSLYSDHFTVYGKTGTAQVEGDNDHSWFTGFVEKDGKCELVITVLIENGGYEKRAVPLVYSILEEIYGF